MKKFMVCAFALVMIAACNKKDDSFMGKSYSATGDNGTEITMEFHPTENRVFGKIVNRYNGAYIIEGNTIKFGPFASTMMMGINGLAMQDERDFYLFMARVNSFDLDGDELTFHTPEGDEMTFEAGSPSGQK